MECGGTGAVNGTCLSSLPLPRVCQKEALETMNDEYDYDDDDDDDDDDDVADDDGDADCDAILNQDQDTGNDVCISQ